MKKTAILLAALLMTSTAAYSDDSTETGNKWLAQCQGEDISFCYGFVLGVVADLSSSSLLARTGRVDVVTSVCPPDDTTAGQLTKIVERYMNTNPQMLHHDASAIIYMAILDVWHCK
jgi:hypothetical protein